MNEIVKDWKNAAKFAGVICGLATSTAVETSAIVGPWALAEYFDQPTPVQVVAGLAGVAGGILTYPLMKRIIHATAALTPDL